MCWRVSLSAAACRRSSGQPFVVENVPGAGGIVGGKADRRCCAGRLHADVERSGALAININMSPERHLQAERISRRSPPLRRCRPLLVIIPSVPANNLSEFIALAKSKPDA